MNNSREDYVFGLDIGTRSIVGTVGYRIGTDRFVVVAQKSLEHTTRAVIDGQIHDIATVADGGGNRAETDECQYCGCRPCAEDRDGVCGTRNAVGDPGDPRTYSFT